MNQQLTKSAVMFPRTWTERQCELWLIERGIMFWLIELDGGGYRAVS